MNLFDYDKLLLLLKVVSIENCNEKRETLFEIRKRSCYAFHVDNFLFKCGLCEF